MRGLEFDRFGNLTARPPFLRVVQDRERAWWRLALCVLALIAASVGILLGDLAVGVGSAAISGDWDRFAASILGKGDQAGLGDDIVFLAQIGLGFGLTSVLFLALLARINGRPMRSWITASPRLRWRLFAAGLVAYGLITLITMGLNWLTQPQDYSFPVFDAHRPLDDRLWYLLALLVFVPLQAGLEEIVNRGWMIQATSSFTSNLAPIILINAAAFTALHAMPGVAINLVYLSTGIALSWAALRLGGLEFAIGCHAANNILIGILQAPFNDEEAGSPTWLDLGQEFAAAAATVLAVEIIVRSVRLRRLLLIDSAP